MVKRYPHPPPSSTSSPSSPDPKKYIPQTLINLLDVCENSPLSQLADFLVRLDNLSYCLVWTATDVQKGATEGVTEGVTDCSIDLVEFPRLGLSFKGRSVAVRLDDFGRPVVGERSEEWDVEKHPGEKGVMECLDFFCVEHKGLRISSSWNPKINKMLEGLFTSVLLQGLCCYCLF